MSIIIFLLVLVVVYFLFNIINSYIGHKNNDAYMKECEECSWLKDYVNEHYPDSDYVLTYEELIKKQEDGTITVNQMCILKYYQERDNKLMHGEVK